MNAELRYTLELGRTLNGTIDGISGAQERVGAELAFDRALRRGRDAIIAMLYAACDDLAPAEGEEIARFIESLEYGEVPAPKISTTDCTDSDDLSGRNGTDRRRNNDDPIIEGARKDAAQKFQNGAGSIESMRLFTGKKSSVKLRARAPKFAKVTAGKPISEQKKGRDFFGKRARKPIANGKSSPEATRDSVPLVPSDEKSAEIMSQWRGA